MIKYTLRPYQQEAVDAVMKYVKRNTDTCMIEVATGGGKAILCADIARQLHDLSKGKRVLIIVPTAELVKQNKEAFDLTGMPSSIYSASVSKSLRHKVVFCTPMSFKPKAKEMGDQFAGVIIDECHLVSNTHKQIIDEMKEGNPNLRVIGMSATPTKLGQGFIYSIDDNDKIVQETRDPYFKKLLYRIDAPLLISLGYLTPPLIGGVDDRYDTSELEIVNNKFTQESIDRAFVGKGRLTAQIVADIVTKSKNARCVMVFASTVKHAYEVMESLPPELSAIITGETPKKERETIMRRVQAKQIKYLVNCAVLTTGVSINHVDVVAILRASESQALITQIIGRGMRLCDNKPHFLLLDYANNIESLFNNNDIFSPSVKAYGSKQSEQIKIMCEFCGTEQEASRRSGFELYDFAGWAIDLSGERLEPNMPAHHLRRCTGVSRVSSNQWKRCDFWWSYKECPSCQHRNDIAARICENCQCELIDPNTKLSDTATVINVGEKTIARVDSMQVKGSDVLYVNFETPHGLIKSKFFPSHKQTHIARHGWAFKKATQDGQNKPSKIEYTIQKSGYASINRYIYDHA